MEIKEKNENENGNITVINSYEGFGKCIGKAIASVAIAYIVYLVIQADPGNAAAAAIGGTLAILALWGIEIL